MPPRRANRPAPRNQTSTSGDFTGRERDRLMAEHAEEVAEAQERTGIMNQVADLAEEHGIFDPATQEVVGGDVGERAEEIVFESDEEILDAGADQTTPLDRMKDLQEPMTQQRPPEPPDNPYEIAPEPPRSDGAVTTLAPMVVFRVNTDIEEMTFGREIHYDDNKNQIVGELRTMSFFRGRRYRGPRELYDHLESKGLIYH